jgi:predicted PurR-regulated permease PerM
MSVERLLLGVLVVGLAIGCVLVLRPFLSAILWAAILVFTTWPVCRWLRVRLGLGRAAAAAVMVLLTAVLLVLPIAIAVPRGAGDVARLRASIMALLEGGLPSAPTWLFTTPLVGPFLTDYWNLWAADFGNALEFFRPWLGMLAEQGLGFLLGLAGGVLQAVLALVVAYFFWSYGEGLARFLRGAMGRVAGEHADRLILLTGATVRGTVYGLLGTALVQGLLTAFGLWIAGVPRPVLLALLAGIISVLPVGAPVVWVPAALWLLAEGRTGWAVFLGTYGLVFISGADHVIRPYFIARGAQLPFLLTILGVLGGALAFGLLGIFLGPVLLGIGYTLAADFAGVPRPAQAGGATAPATSLAGLARRRAWVLGAGLLGRERRPGP